MIKLPYSLLFGCILSGQLVSAQSVLPEFGEFPAEEINLKECAFDKNADAIILLDEAVTSFEAPNKSVLTRRIRIKILTERGFSRANITLPFLRKDDYETIRNIAGDCYVDNTTYSLSKKSTFIEKVDDQYSEVKFTFPNVKVGCIIEYKYDWVVEGLGALNYWYFQSDIPTLKSCYNLSLPFTKNTTYAFTKTTNHPIIIKENKEKARIYFEMNNIPAFRFEPFMDAPSDYLQKVEFQFSDPDESTKNIRKSDTWNAIASDLSESEFLGQVLKKQIPITDEVKEIATGRTSSEKIAVIYNYVKNNFHWDGSNSLYASEGLKKVCETKTGNSGELNLLLVKLLQDNDIDASALLVAERDFGEVDPELPFLRHFNKTVVYAWADGKSMVLDVTEKYLPIGLTPFQLLNTYALVIDKKTTGVIQIVSKNESYKTYVVVNAALDTNAILSGIATIFDYDYAKLLQTENIKRDEKKFLQKSYEEKYEGLTVSEFSCDNIDSSAELVEHLTFNDNVDESGGYLLLNYDFFTNLRKNPFTMDERITNVNFGFPIKMEIEENIELPKNVILESTPKNKKLATADKTIELSREITKSGNTLQIRIKFSQSVTLVSNNEYAALKSFYTMMVDMLNEPITVKLNSK